MRLLKATVLAVALTWLVLASKQVTAGRWPSISSDPGDCSPFPPFDRSILGSSADDFEREQLNPTEPPEFRLAASASSGSSSSYVGSMQNSENLTFRGAASNIPRPADGGPAQSSGSVKPISAPSDARRPALRLRADGSFDPNGRVYSSLEDEGTPGEPFV